MKPSSWIFLFLLVAQRITLFDVVLADIGLADEPRYSLSDLHALEKSKSWEELLRHAEDVPTSDRDEKWEKMIETAAEKYPLKLLDSEQPFAALDVVEALLKRFSFLKDSPALQEVRGRVAQSGLKTCFGLSYGGATCIERIGVVVDGERPGSRLALEIGKLMMQNGHAAAAVSPFHQFLAGNHGKRECTDEDIVHSLFAAFEASPRDQLATAGRDIVTRFCAEPLHPLLLEQLGKKKKGSPYARNVCGILRETGGLDKWEDRCPPSDGDVISP